MIIIGEKINGSRKSVAKAIAERDAAFIQGLAKKQADAGAEWLDVHAGTTPDKEIDALGWLADTVQAATECKICLDSPNPAALAAVLPRLKQTPMINSISGEKKRLEGVMPLLRKNKSPVIMLAMDDAGIPKTADDRLFIVRAMMMKMRENDVEDDRVYIDPLAIALATDTNAGKLALSTIKMIHYEFPDVHIVSGLSNVSYGLPARTLINQAFITLAMEAGMDSAIMDPLDTALFSATLAAEVVLGKDRFCRSYNTAFRAGRLLTSK
jgi:cobalamin-dependent methionine synthase I